MDEVKNSINSSIALGKLIDSLSIAFKKNTPLEEAIPPEAREQAYGKKSLTKESISKGLFSSLVKDNNIGIGDNTWNPYRTENSGGLLQMQLVAFSSKNAKGEMDILIDMIKFVKSTPLPSK